MKVKAILNKLMLSSSIERVRIVQYRMQYRVTVAEYDAADLRRQEYGPWGEATVSTFEIHGETLVINVK